MILPERVFGRSAVKQDLVGPRDRADLLRRRARAARRASSAVAAWPSCSVTNATIAWPLISCGPADDRRLGHRRVLDERALDLHRADAVARDVHHVVDAADDPEVAVLVALARRRR